MVNTEISSRDMDRIIINYRYIKIKVWNYIKVSMYEKDTSDKILNDEYNP